MTSIQFAMQAPYKTAIYLPAVQGGYLDLIDAGDRVERKLPEGVNIDDLAFWTGKSNIFNHKFCLYSVGGQQVGSSFINPLFRGNIGNHTVVGDSGGFQIANGTLKGLVNLEQGIDGDSALSAWKFENYDAKDWILSSLNTYFDYSMTIDMPLSVRNRKNENSPFHNCTEEQLIEMTVDNLIFIEEHQLNLTKWLNVIHGTDITSFEKWWNAVKFFKQGGWALAGGVGWRGGLYNVLYALLTMRDEGAFSKGDNWVHMLGVSQPVWSVLFTAIQRELRKINPELQISFDSSSPFLTGGKFDQYANIPSLSKDIESWGISYELLDAVQSNFQNSALAFPNNPTLLGERIEMGHLVIREGMFEARRIDNLSNQLLANHNIWVYLEAVERANAIAFGTERHLLPDTLRNALEIIEEAFNVRNWREFVKNNKSVLDALAPSE